MATVGHRVFLSYRREEAAGHAGRLADHLLDRFGQGSVFMDVESIEAGADFTAEIEHAIAGSDAVLVVIGPGWLGAEASSGTRRLDDPADFVRREIEAALSSEVRVIPVLVGGAHMPAGAELPETIAPLAHRNAVELQDRRWREDVDTLVDVLEGRGRGTLGNLPRQPTPFLGRERELAELTELLRSQDVRLLTLTGPGGIGKTRLAVQAAAKLSHAYPGGAWFVGLAAVTEPDLVLIEVGHVFDIRDGTNESLVQAIAERVSRARTLIVLDNIEQLLPSGASLIADLLSAAPTVDLIVSSREPLHLIAEREYPVNALSEEEAVALFVARSRVSVPDFELHGGERGTVSAICARLDRLPLAIELAAARAKLLSPGKLLERLEQRLPILTGGARDAPERHRTLHATIAWSYDLLTMSEQTCFRRLAVFAEGWTLEAAETVCDADLDTLQSLLERSLVRTVDGVGDGLRFFMLETIREFAHDRLEETSEAETLRGRHAAYFVAMAMSGDPESRGSGRSEWLERIDAEHDNHRATLRWALDGGDPDLGLQLIVELRYSWYLRRSISEARRWFAEAIERTPPLPTEVRAKALDWAGYLAGEQGEDAIALFEESIRCAREAGATATEAMATSHLSGFLPPDRAHERVPLGQRAVALARASGDRWALPNTLNNLGELHRADGDLVSASVAYEESLLLLREMEDISRVALLLSNLAETAIVAGDAGRAQALATEALEHAESLGDRRHAALAHAALGWVALDHKLLDEASDRLSTAITLMNELGFRGLSVTLLFGMAGVAAARGDVSRAARLEALADRFEELLGSQPTPADAGIHTRYLNELRASTASSVWDAAAREGASMSLEQGIEYALAG